MRYDVIAMEVRWRRDWCDSACPTVSDDTPLCGTNTSWDEEESIFLVDVKKTEEVLGSPSHL